jgi:hypothetical protein
LLTKTTNGTVCFTTPYARQCVCAYTVALLMNGLTWGMGGQTMPIVRYFQTVCKYSPKNRQNSNTVLYK